LTVGGDDNHTLSIWDWRRRPDKPLLEYSTSKAEICNIECCPREMPGTLLRFATVGEKHLKLHKITVDSRGDLSFQARIPSGFSKTNIAQKCYTDACYLDNGTIAIATVSGHIYIYDGESYDLLKFYKAHAGPVGALTALDKGFASGGSDGFLRAWTNSGKPMQEEIELDMRGSKKVVVRSLDALNGRLIVGTKNCEIFETSFDDGLTKMVMCGNSDDVWALATHPTKPVMAVGGDDMVVRLWDFKAKKVLLKVRCKAAVKECCFDREGKRLALGLADGGVCMLDIASAKMIFEDKVCAEQVSAMMFHPNGKQLAVVCYPPLLLPLSFPQAFPFLPSPAKYLHWPTHRVRGTRACT
jgi:WD40 repeat protein